MSGLGIVVAMASEARTLTKAPWSPGELLRFPGGGILNISGIGARRAGAAARVLLSAGVKGLVSWGTAGGLIPELTPGNLILPRVILRSDQTCHEVDPAWRRRLCEQLEGRLSFHEGPVGESPKVLVTPQDKQAFSSRTGAVAVDMESGAVAAVASGAKVPFIAIRAVSDPLDTVLPFTALKAFDRFGRLDALKFVRELARTPQDIPRWWRFMRQFRSAKETLASVAHLTGGKGLVL